MVSPFFGETIAKFGGKAKGPPLSFGEMNEFA